MFPGHTKIPLFIKSERCGSSVIPFSPFMLDFEGKEEGRKQGSMYAEMLNTVCIPFQFSS